MTTATQTPDTEATQDPVATTAPTVPTYRWGDLSEEQRENIEDRILALLDKVDGLWIYGLPMERYLALPAMSASGLVAFRKSPKHFRHKRDNPKEPTSAMMEGTALHTALLEPDEFEDRYVVVGQCDGKTNAGKRCSNQGSVYRAGESYCKIHDPNDGAPMAPEIEVVKEDALERIKAGRDAILEHPKASEFFRGVGHSEVTGVWCDPDTGVPCKLRLDREIERATVHADVKWTNDASEGGFYHTARRMGYAWRSAWYRHGMELLGKPAIGSVLIAAEQDPPHGVQCFVLDEGEIDTARRYIPGYLRRYARCLERDEWPSYSEDLTPLSVLREWDLPDDMGDELLQEGDF